MTELVERLEKLSIKQKLGQFYTTNADHILADMNVPKRDVIEPFVGNGDLIKHCHNPITYDIDPQNDITIKRDTLSNPPDMSKHWIITNPPYLARNKSKDKTIYDKYNCNDLYKCFIKILITNQPLGGILIVPLNFWCSIRKADIALRRDFLAVYWVDKIKIFEKQVFDDTSYAVCCFSFTLGSQDSPTKIVFIPSNKTLSCHFTDDNNYMVGGEIYKLPKSEYTIDRITSKNKDDKNKTNILVKCIDDNKDNQLGLSITTTPYVDETLKLSARTYASLIISPKVLDEKKLVEDCNKFIKEYREKYNSLFLTNYRENKDIARKRISFDLVYSIISYLLR